MSDNPCFYKNDLSVRKWTDCYYIGSTYPWSDLSAVTLDIETDKEVSLTDILNIDDSLNNKIYEGVFVNVKLSKEEYL